MSVSLQILLVDHITSTSGALTAFFKVTIHAIPVKQHVLDSISSGQATTKMEAL